MVTKMSYRETKVINLVSHFKFILLVAFVLLSSASITAQTLYNTKSIRLRYNPLDFKRDGCGKSIEVTYAFGDYLGVRAIFFGFKSQNIIYYAKSGSVYQANDFQGIEQDGFQWSTYAADIGSFELSFRLKNRFTDSFIEFSNGVTEDVVMVNELSNSSGMALFKSYSIIKDERLSNTDNWSSDIVLSDAKIIWCECVNGENIAKLMQQKTIVDGLVERAEQDVRMANSSVDTKKKVGYFESALIYYDKAHSIAKLSPLVVKKEEVQIRLDDLRQKLQEETRIEEEQRLKKQAEEEAIKQKEKEEQRLKRNAEEEAIRQKEEEEQRLKKQAEEEAIEQKKKEEFQDDSNNMVREEEMREVREKFVNSQREAAAAQNKFIQMGDEALREGNLDLAISYYEMADKYVIVGSSNAEIKSKIQQVQGLFLVNSMASLANEEANRQGSYKGYFAVAMPLEVLTIQEAYGSLYEGQNVLFGGMISPELYYNFILSNWIGLEIGAKFRYHLEGRDYLPETGMSYRFQYFYLPAKVSINLFNHLSLFSIYEWDKLAIVSELSSNPDREYKYGVDKFSLSNGFGVSLGVFEDRNSYLKISSSKLHGSSDNIGHTFSKSAIRIDVDFGMNYLFLNLNFTHRSQNILMNPLNSVSMKASIIGASAAYWLPF
tara:strand:+ start:2557 stop:4536 length:1980 start_codon:yes stop_codon:yes gene_type:complete